MAEMLLDWEGRTNWTINTRENSLYKESNAVWHTAFHKEEATAKVFSRDSKAKKTTALPWLDILPALENIAIQFRLGRSMSDECDKILLKLYDHRQKVSEKDFDYVIIVALQTYLNDFRILQSTNRKKAQDKLLRTIEITKAVEDAKHIALELDLEPVVLKKIDEYNGEPVYAF